MSLEVEIKGLAKEVGLTQCEVILSQNIQFRSELRAICEANQCGRYRTNWSCPPAIGQIQQAREALLDYEKGIVLQTIHTLEDCFDLEGMMEGKKQHKVQLLALLEGIYEKFPNLQLLPLSVGGCEECSRCSYLDQQPCRFKQKCIPGMEGYGIDVYQMTQLAGLKYNNGPNTVSYVSFIGWR